MTAAMPVARPAADPSPAAATLAAAAVGASTVSARLKVAPSITAPAHAARAAAPDDDTACALDGLGELVSHVGSAGFAEAGLAALNGPLQAASWSVYRVWQDRAPQLHLSAARGVADTTRHCFAAYRDGLYRLDRSFDAVGRAAAVGRRATVLHMRADDAPTDAHRERIYRRHGLAERLSVAAAEADGSLLAVNLYHHEHQGAFSGLERERFEHIAPVVLAAVRRHLSLTGEAPLEVSTTAPVAALLAQQATASATGAHAAHPHGVAGRAASASATARERLREACPALTERELDVCERLLRGWSHDGVAADLGLSATTVKTYRARAFGRLGLHFRSELFARFGSNPPPAARPG